MKILGTVKLFGERLMLRPIALNDAEELLHGYINQPEHCYHHNCKPMDLPQLREHISRILAACEKGRCCHWLICLRDESIIGEIQLRCYPHNDSAEVWYSIDAAYCRQGHATEALSLVRDFALQEMHIHRLQAACIKENRASRRVLKKCGFQYEGCLRQYIRLSDGFHDMEIYAILPEKQ